MTKFTPFFIALTVAILFLNCSNAYAAKDDPLITLSVKGVSEELEKNIIAHLGTLPTSKMERRAFMFNIKANTTQALESLGYYHGSIDRDVSRSKTEPWKLTLTVDAGERTKIQWIDIQLQGEILEDKFISRWLRKIELRPGMPLNHAEYETIKSQLITVALARGYFDSRYEKSELKVNRDINLAQINLIFDSGVRYRIGDIDFDGHTLEEGFLDELIPFKQHAIYSSRKLTRLNNKLNDTNYFSNIKVLPQVDKLADGQVPVKVELTPKPDHSVDIGAGIDIGSSVENSIEPRVQLSWRTPQINSYGHSLENTAEWSPDRPKFLSTYTIPLTHPLNDQLKIKVGILRDEYGVTQEYDAGDDSYEETGQLESTKLLLGVERSLNLKNKWAFGYSVEAIKEDYDLFNENYNPFFLLFGTSLSKTIRGDNTLDPKSGFRQSYSFEYADPALGSEVRIAKLEAEFKFIHTFAEKHRFVSRLDLGVNIIDDDDMVFIPPSLRYFAGGDDSIRGFTYQELGPYFDYTNDDGVAARDVVGGRYLAVGSLEYQYYFAPTWRVATFVDAGNAFNENQFDPAIAVGGGIHWISPIGPIKFDVGFGVENPASEDTPWRIHLSMGSEL